MHEIQISRLDLYEKLGGLNQKDWIKAVGRLAVKYPEYYVSTSGGKGSHAVFRNSTYPIDDKRGVILTMASNTYKVMHQKMFRQLLKYFKEDEIWEALGLM